MGERKAKVGSETTTSGLAGAFLDANWQDRLKEARAKREKALSARSKEKSNEPATETRTTAVAAVGAVTAQPTETEIGVQLNGADALKALLVFAAAAGFGLGAVLGIGILIGWGQTDSTGATQITAHVTRQSAPAPVLQVDRDTPAPAKAISLVTKEITLFDALLSAPDLAPPQPEFSAIPSLPIAMGTGRDAAESPRLDAVRVRSLPEPSKVGDVFSLIKPVVPKVFIHAPTGVEQARLLKYRTRIKAAGIEVAGIGRESFRVSTTHLRYYSPDTQDAAMELAADLGLTARDFSQNALVPGRIEIWVSGQPRKRVVRKRRPRTKQSTEQTSVNRYQNER